MTVFTSSSLYTPLEQIDRPLLFVEDGIISELSSQTAREVPANAAVVDFGSAILAPGFIDIHIHGSAGRDVMEPSPDAFVAIGKFLWDHGVTGYFPTTVAAPLQQTLSALGRMADAIESPEGGSGAWARPLGIHLEGPFLSHKRRGVHPPENLLPPTLETFDRLWQAARGHVRVITIAPELEGAREVIAEAARRGVCVSIGHSDADMTAARAAVEAGARHATHTFNAMRPLDHRDPGIVGEVLTDDRLTADIIADGIHVAPAVVQLFLQAKGAERAVLITDATAAAGMPEGRYRLGSFEVDVKDGICTIDGKLAGSALTLDRAVRNVAAFAHWSLQQSVRAATLNPARVVGATPRRGLLAPGAEADLVALSPRGEVQRTVVHGQVF